MTIYLVRHGDSAASYNDDERILSPAGRLEVDALAQFLASRDIHVSYLFHGIKIRAKQTAEILASVVHVSHPIESKDYLNPDSSLDLILNEINNREGNLMLVGHMPFMGMLVSQLVCGNADVNTVNFKTASMVCLEEIENRRWAINWMICPDLLLRR